MKNCSTIYILPEAVNKKENEAKKKLIAFFGLLIILNKISSEKCSFFFLHHGQRLTKAKQGKLSVLIYTFISFVL
jgi:hypothetical protein